MQFRYVHNTRKSGENSTVRFNPTSQSVQPVRIAFLTTGGTASASEMNINSMLPWVEIAMFGDDTLGKPVGQYAFDLPGCQDRLRLVTFKTVNALGQGDYYDGLAALVPTACAATDTLDEPLGSASEGMVSAALGWLGGNRRVRADGQAASRAPRPPGNEFAQRYPRPRHPSAAQWWLPGLE